MCSKFLANREIAQLKSFTFVSGTENWISQTGQSFYAVPNTAE